MSKRTSLRTIEEQAALYALGALGPDEAGKFQKRMAAGCEFCQMAFDECRVVTEALPLSAPDIAPRPELRQRLMDRIGAKVERKKKAPVGKLVRPGDTAWESPAPGIDIRPLLGKQTMLVRMAPGTVLPEHDHEFGEQCLVLEGSIRSEHVVAVAGDFTYMPAGSSHPPLYTDTGCLLLITYA